MMKIYLSAILFFLGQGFLTSQNFINGDFEINTSTDCDYNNTDSLFNTKMSNVYAFGKAYIPSAGGYVGEVDIQTIDCFVTPQNGNWCLGLSSDTASTSDAIAIELTSDLVVGQTYRISFYIYGNSNFENIVQNVQIGVSENDSTFGSEIYEAQPVLDSWENFVINYAATNSYRFITVANVPGIRGWNQIDNFSISIVNSISKNEINEFNFYPNPVSNQLNISNSKVKGEFQIYILDATGRLMQNEQYSGIGSHTLNLSSLAQGIYYCKIILGNEVMR